MVQDDMQATNQRWLMLRRTPSPGVVVLLLAVMLLAVIVVGVVLSRRGDGEASGRVVTIAELRTDPERYDNQIVTLEGDVYGVREVPYLSQYAMYTTEDATGTMLVLTQSGAPPDGTGMRYRITGRFHSKVTLDDELKRIIQDKVGTIAGSVVSALLPGMPLHVVFLEHQRYEPLAP